MTIKDRVVRIVKEAVEISGEDPSCVELGMKPAQELGSLIALEMTHMLEQEFGLEANSKLPNLFVANGKALAVSEVIKLVEKRLLESSIKGAADCG